MDLVTAMVTTLLVMRSYLLILQGVCVGGGEEEEGSGEGGYRYNV